jgi:hypothetical protein
MSYRRCLSFSAGTSNTGLADLRAQLMTEAGVDTGSAISTGFFEVGRGLYGWDYAGFADTFRGFVRFYSAAASSTPLSAVEINPEDYENLDAKVSTRLATAGYTAPDNATISSISSALSAVATNVTSLLARLGAFTGTGLNTVLGFLRAMSRLDAGLTPSDMGGTYDNTTDSLEAGAGGALTAASVWSYASRTLTQTAAEVAAVLTGTDLIVKRGDTWTITLTGLGSLAGRSKLWFTVKRQDGHADTDAVLQIEESAGLLRLNGAAGTSGQGSLTVTSAGSGDVTISVAAVATDDLTVETGLTWDIQMLVGAAVTTLTEGTLEVTADRTRAVS